MIKKSLVVAIVLIVAGLTSACASGGKNAVSRAQRQLGDVAFERSKLQMEIENKAPEAVSLQLMWVSTVDCQPYWSRNGERLIWSAYVLPGPGNAQMFPRIQPCQELVGRFDHMQLNRAETRVRVVNAKVADARIVRESVARLVVYPPPSLYEREGDR